MRVALVHDWLITFRGGEKVLQAIAELYPDADIYTLFHEPGGMPADLEAHPIIASYLDRLPYARSRHRQLLPFFPGAIERFSLEGYQLVISSSHCVAKGVRKPTGARHLSYVHAPMRYMWDRFDDYFGPGQASPPARLAARTLRPWLQRWDIRSAEGIDRIVANSHHVAGQIATRWGRQASVLHPPVELERFAREPLTGLGEGGYFLWLGALAPYKRVDLAIEAFTHLGLPLWIGGGGQQEALVTAGLPPNIRYLGHVPDAELPALYRNARAFLFTGEEDFGLTPLEAQACGRPVIALGRGGAVETVTERTGLFFPEPAVSAITAAVREFIRREPEFSPTAARAQASRFSRAAFQRGFREAVAEMLREA